MVSVMSRRPVVLNTDDLDRRSTMPFDVAATRAQFPSLASGIAHFDRPGWHPGAGRRWGNDRPNAHRATFQSRHRSRQ
jgi:hypothetical protein